MVEQKTAERMRVPVIAVTGHLGSGKTSLLNHLLREPGARIGVVINDFGELNVDAALVTGQVDQAAAISGGCLCCLPNAGGLDDALQQLSQPKLRLDAIIVEASGVADPVALARIIQFSDVGNVRLGGVVEVIDAVEHFRTVDTEPIPPSRYAVTTLAVIGKTDLLTAAEREAVSARIRDRIRERNPDVYTVTADYGRIDPQLVFDTVTEEDPLDQLPIAQLLREEAAQDHTGHQHASSVSREFAETVLPGALVDLLENPPAGAYRMKGRLRVRGPRQPRGYLVNVVGRSVQVERLREVPEAGELVVIGMDLATDAAAASLEALAAADGGSPDKEGLARLERHRRLSE
ncbi:CobW family GTP-binding protein [Gulosibacter chungangensis]|uniref:Cobalamin biosynthesis protein CobW n=1 Tax=Gulosibacter chungangensis TaxID=979746 RepID=A0A7J5BAC6_9MICO|nr:GTP-binding protein [Gulosibacter chungangensis]KAB1642718.1 cobalamin biosynthesis protein CobW [Gulosibacter chungangensis]